MLLWAHLYPDRKVIKMGAPALSDDNLELLLEKVYKEKGWDFRRYRKSSIKRCIERRLAYYRLSHSPGLQKYTELLDLQASEYNNLFNHLTIKVSEFFRNPEVFLLIEKNIIPPLIKRLRAEGRGILKIWSCGCAKGEESYSMAILLAKMFQGREFTGGIKVKLFATDIDEAAINIARKGIYSEDSIKNVPYIFRNQFFKSAGNSYQVLPLIRNLVIFGIHNIVSDIHLSHIDIILCRNLLIYFEKDLQERVFEKFCYSLNKGGYIILGKSEVIPSLYRNRFREVFRKEKIYQKI